MLLSSHSASYNKEIRKTYSLHILNNALISELFLPRMKLIFMKQGKHLSIGPVTSLGPVVPEGKLRMGSVCVEHPHVFRGKQLNKMRGLQELFLTIQDQSSLFRNVH